MKNLRFSGDDFKFFEASPHGVVVNMLDCDIVVSEFKLKSHYYVYFCSERNLVIIFSEEKL